MIRLTEKFDQRKLIRLLAVLWVAAGVWLLSVSPGLHAAAVQDKQPSSETVPRVALAEITGTPGANLMMPFYFTPDPKAPLRSVTVDIEFVSNNLKFEKASNGTAADQAGAAIATSVTEGKADDKGVTRSKLRVTASIADPNTKEGLPDGLLAYLLFQITLDAKPFAIKLIPTVVEAQDIQNPSKKMAKVGADPGLVMVEVLDVMPEATCFFFTH
jgi:hypothetical protein